jgi:hypothetical protein
MSEVEVCIGGHFLGCGVKEGFACDCAERIYDEFHECPECGGPLDEMGFCKDQYWDDCVWVGQIG